jgi:hypothetical protein
MSKKTQRLAFFFNQSCLKMTQIEIKEELAPIEKLKLVQS